MGTHERDETVNGPEQQKMEEERKDASLGTDTKTQPVEPASRTLPPWNVYLHNDEINEIIYVVKTVRHLTPLGKEESINRTLEAHHHGKSLLLTTHQERAELYVQQFSTRNLTVTIHKA